MAKIDDILRLAVSKKGSDIHFSSGEPIRCRIHGDLEVLEERPLESVEILELLFELLSEEEKEKLLNEKNLDKSLSVSGLSHFRLNIFFTRKGASAVFRVIPSKVPTIEELGLPPVIPELCNLEKGLVLVTGPTGSGKSTTLAAMINHINSHGKNHILTVEDPVEFVHLSKMSLVNQREIGSSCKTFSDALKYALREDPDVILIGEMRDLETIGLALTAAETGHLVFGTLHTRGAGASIDRIIDSFPANQQAMIRTMLAESLKAVISQALFKKASGDGRVAAYEIMVVNTAISNLIREGKTFQIPSAIQVGRKDGMMLMDQAIIELVQRQEVNPEDVMPLVDNTAAFEAVLKNLPKTKVSKAPARPQAAVPQSVPMSPPRQVQKTPPPLTSETPVSSVVRPSLPTTPPTQKPTNPPPPSLKTVTQSQSPNSNPKAVESVPKVDSNQLVDEFKRLLNEDDSNSDFADVEILSGDQKKAV